MARVNVEDCWWSDPRRTELIMTIGFETDSAVVNMWRTAQEFWSRGRKLIPKRIFDRLKHAQVLLDVDLAEVRGDEVYVRGSSTYLDWLHEKREAAKEAGSKGGKKSSQRPRDEKGRLLAASPGEEHPSEVQAKSKRSPSNIQATSKQHPSEVQAKPSESKPSGSYSGSNKTKEGESPPSKSKKPKLDPTLVALYVDQYKARFARRPEITGKDQGILLRVQKSVGVDRAKELLERYLKSENPWFKTNAFDLATFENKLNVIAAEGKGGLRVVEL